MRALLARSDSHGLYWALPIEAWPPVLERHAPYFTDWLDHPTYDDYWRRWSIDERLQPPARARRCTSAAGTTRSFSGSVKNFAELQPAARAARRSS